MNFTPCSEKHKSCSPAHAALVWGYRAERARQEQARDKITNGHAGDERHWRATGGKLITFKDWLKANKGNGNQNGSLHYQSGENGVHAEDETTEDFSQAGFDNPRNRCWDCGDAHCNAKCQSRWDSDRLRKALG